MTTITKEILHFHMACGIGGGAIGFNNASARVGNLVAKFRCLGGIDVDPAACRDFTRLVGVPASCIDLFSREQYAAFHGREPPEGWREATPADIHRACGGERPHIVFASYPCKGFSGLLSEKTSGTAKYQALNGLLLRGMMLVLEAFKDDPVELIIFENVPRIATRGRWLLDQYSALLRAHCYAIAETTHDCGELGNLAQSRKRFLMVARHTAKVPNFLYEPVKRRLRGVGEVLDKLPLPLSGIGGPMHRMPALQWKTWVRLAFVKAGSDWRSLNDLSVENGVLKDFGIAPDHYLNHGVLGVRRWDQPAPTVTGRSAPLTGAHAVADPRIDNQPHAGSLGVRQWHEPSCTVAGRSWPHNNAFAVSDPRIEGHPKSVQLGVRPWAEPAGVVTGKMYVGGGPHSVADPRIEGKPRFNNVFRIVPWDAASPAVAGPGGPAGGLAVADPRAGEGRHVNGKYRVTAFDEPAGAVIAASTTGNGAFVVADPRVDGRARSTQLGVHEWTEATGVVAGESYPTNGAFAVADPRTDNEFGGMRIVPWEKHAGAVTGQRSPGSSAMSVADPRTGYGPNSHRNKLVVVDWDEHARTVTGANQVQGGALSVADPRPDFARDGRDKYLTAGHYGVVPYDAAMRAVTAAGQHDNGFNSVADPRMPLTNLNGESDVALPGPNDRLVCLILALDGTWHRPFTTLELAAIQSLIDPEEFLILDGLSDSAWRERIGNMVPPEASKAMGGVLGRCLLGAWSGQTFMLSSEPIWVQPVAIALMAAQ
ncbi:MAG TPA: DNA cytosine methyltransferase [Xanthobacteraceae bacterium]|nr:DNA cytosine methyltransferase [Xanthobacteraceae bacterium]